MHIIREVLAAVSSAVFFAMHLGLSSPLHAAEFEAAIIPAAVIEHDDRTPLSRSVVKLSGPERERMMRCTGWIICQDKGSTSTFSAGAVCPLMPQPAEAPPCAADRLATVAHGFVKKSDKSRLAYRSDQCVFQNYRGHRSGLNISDLSSIEPTKLYSQGREANPRHDRVVVRLKSPIPQCDAYEIAQSDDARKVGQDVVAVTFKQAGMTMAQSDGSEPLVFPCQVRKVFQPKDGLAGAYYTDCDVNGGGSGGFMMHRDVRGTFVVSGLFSGSSPSAVNGSAYDEAKNFTVVFATHYNLFMLANFPGEKQ